MRKIFFLILLISFPIKVFATEVLEENDVINREVKGAYLKKLEVENYELSPKFDQMNNDYTLSIPSNIKEVKITADPYYLNSRIQIIGNTNLEYGENIVTIKVAFENDIQEYKIIITREKEKTVINYENSLDDEKEIQSVHKDKYLITMIASGTGFLILILGLFLFKRKKR